MTRSSLSSGTAVRLQRRFDGRSVDLEAMLAARFVGEDARQDDGHGHGITSKTRVTWKRARGRLR
jgi:hypothetical protein